MWPTFFPDSCPPEDSEPAFGVVYRFILGSTPVEEDFLSHRERFPDREFSGITECEVCGVSVYKNHEDTQRLQRRIARFRRQKLAAGTIRPDLGMIKCTPRETEPSHHSWWVNKESSPWLIFEVI